MSPPLKKTSRSAASLEMSSRRARAGRTFSEFGTVAAVVAHDLNNVLTLIRGCAGMLRVLPGLTPAQEIELDDLNGGVRHGTELVRQMFAYARRPTAAADIDLNGVIARMGWMLRRLGRKKISVDLLLRRGLGRIKAEPVQIERVLFNLAVNACEAMPDGGRLMIETGNVSADAVCPSLPPIPAGSYVRLAVSDSGAGIPSEVRRRLFEPYVTTKRGGTGLGLFSVRRIAEECGAHIRVRGAGDEGTVFDVYFPRADAATKRIPL